MAKTIAVTCASSRMGQPLVRELVAAGYHVRAITRNADMFPGNEYRNVTTVDADFSDVMALTAAFTGADAVCSAIPSLAAEHSSSYATNLVIAAKQAGVSRIVHNSMMWVSDSPSGEPFYDSVLNVENIIAGSGLDVTIFRPVLFMDNLLTAYVKPNLIGQGVYRYCQRPGMLATWIAMEDVAKFIVAALTMDNLIGRRIVIGGPETIPVEEVVDTLSWVLDRPIRYEYEDPYDWAERVHEEVLHGTVMARKDYRKALGDFYTFNHESPLKPFEIDMGPVLKEIPVKMSTLREWVSRQDWSLDGSGKVGSITG